MREPPTETIRSTGWNVSSQVPDSQGYPDPPARGLRGARGVGVAASHGLQAREPGPGSLHRQREAAPRLFAAFGPSEAPPPRAGPAERRVPAGLPVMAPPARFPLEKARACLPDLYATAEIISAQWETAKGGAGT